MQPSDVLSWIRVVIVLAMGCWLCVFVLNNITDPDTNSPAVSRMLSMRELRDDPDLGNGVVWRAIDAVWAHRLAYRSVIAVQTIAALALLIATILLAVGAARGAGTQLGVAVADIGLGLFVALWFACLVGGTWFCYWVKMGPVQQGHHLLLLTGLASLIAVNLPAA